MAVALFSNLPTLVTPAKAGVHHLPVKFQPPVMDSRLRGNDEDLELKVWGK